MDLLVWLAFGVAIVAFLYSSVGHAGAIPSSVITAI